MPINTQLQDISSKVRMRWREQYVSEGLNQKMLPIPKGIYRGFGLIADSATARAVDVVADATIFDHLAVAETTNGFSMTIHMPNTGAGPPPGTPAGSFLIDLSAAQYNSQTVVIALIISYAVSATTTAAIQAYDLASFLALPVDSAVALGTVVVPAGNVLIPAGNVTLANRNGAWQNKLPESVTWDPLLRNGSFEAGPIASIPFATGDATGQQVPFWNFSNSDASSHWAIQTNPSTGGGSKNLTYLIDNAAVVSTANAHQVVDVPVVAGQHIRYRFQLKMLHLLTAGTVTVFAEWRDLNGAINPATVSDIILTTSSVVDGAYRAIDAVMTVPSGALYLHRWGIQANAVTWTAAPGDSGLWLDDFSLWMEVQNPQLPYMFENRRGDEVVSNLTFQDPAQTSFGQSGMTAQFGQATDSGVGRLKLVRRDGRGNETATNTSYLPGLDLAQIFLGNNVSALTALGVLRSRVTAQIASGGFTLLWENLTSTAGQSRSRIYAQGATGAWILTTNAFYDGTNWNADDVAQPARKMLFNISVVELRVKNSTAAPWLDGSGWDDVVTLSDDLVEFGSIGQGFEMYTTNDVEITVNGFTAVIGGMWRSHDFATTLVSGGVLAGLGNSTGYYLYCYWDGSGVLFEYSTTVPDVQHRVKNGDPSRTYIGYFRTMTTGKIRAFRRINRTTQYLSDLAEGSAAAPLYSVDGSVVNNSTPQTINMGLSFPAHVRVAKMRVGTTGTAGDNVTIKGTGAQVTFDQMNIGVASVNFGGTSTTNLRLQPTYTVYMNSSREVIIQMSVNTFTTVLIAHEFED